jgi:hypothetical protein
MGPLLAGNSNKNDDLACRELQKDLLSQHLARVLLNTVEAKNCVLKKKLRKHSSLTLNTLKYV